MIHFGLYIDDISQTCAKAIDRQNVVSLTYGLPFGESYLRIKMLEIIDKEGLPNGVSHSLRPTNS